MPCCHWVLSLAKSSSNNNTPPWLHRLHAKGGLSFPSHLQIDDLFYGQPQRPAAPPRPPPPPTLFPPPPPPPPASSDRRLAVINPQDPLPKPKPPRDPARPNPSGNNDISYHPAQPQTQPPPPPLSGVISDLFAVPSAARSGRPPLKPFRKQSRPRPRPKDKSASKDDKEKAKARKRRRADRGAGVVDGERRSKTEVTVIDTSTDGWKTAKLILRRGTSLKLRDRKYSEISENEELNKGKRRAGLVAKVLRDKEKGKEAASPDPLPKPKPACDPARPNPSGNNDISYHPAQTQSPPPLSDAISDLFVVPSAALKPFSELSPPHPRPKDKSASKDGKEKAKARKHRRADRCAGVVDGERRSKTEVTVIDTSTDGWKTAKLILRRGPSFKVRDRKYSEISETEELNKGKSRARLVAKVLVDKEKEKEAASQGNIHSGSGYLKMIPGDDAIEAVKRPRSSEPVPGGSSASILLLPSSSTLSQP